MLEAVYQSTERAGRTCQEWGSLSRHKPPHPPGSRGAEPECQDWDRGDRASWRVEAAESPRFSPPLPVPGSTSASSL